MKPVCAMKEDQTESLGERDIRESLGKFTLFYVKVHESANVILNNETVIS
jgi:hypothetical protein